MSFFVPLVRRVARKCDLESHYIATPLHSFYICNSYNPIPWDLASLKPGRIPRLVHSSQPVTIKNRDKIHEKVGFLVKNRDIVGTQSRKIGTVS